MNIIKTNVPQDPLQAALMQNAQLNNQLGAAQQLQNTNGWGGGLGILAAALGGYMQNKKGKELAANEYDINQQIAAFQAQKQQEMAAAEQAKADAEYKRKMEEERVKREHDLAKIQAQKDADYQNQSRLQNDRQSWEARQTQSQRDWEANNTKPDYKAGNDLRKEFQGLQPVKNFDEVNASYQKVVSSAKNPSAASDIALITGFMKMNDPGSTVREGEFATAANAGGVSEKLRNTYNSLLNGQRLTPEQREDFVMSAGQLYGAHADQYQRARDNYGRLAENMSLNPDEIFINRKIHDWQPQQEQQQSPVQFNNEYMQQTANLLDELLRPKNVPRK